HQRARRRRPALGAPAGPAVEGGRHGDAARRGAAAARGCAPPRRSGRHSARARDGDGEGGGQLGREVRVRRGDSAAWRLRLQPRVPGRARLPRHPRTVHRSRDGRDPAQLHRLPGREGRNERERRMARPARQRVTLRPTYRHPRARDYLAPGGAWDIPSLDAVVSDAARSATGDLVVDDSAGVRLDGRALEAQVAALAGGLRGAGVRRRDVVAWQSPNWHEAVVLYRACWRLGAIAAPIHHQAGPADVERMPGTLDAQGWLPADELRGPSARLPKLLDAGTPVTRSAARPSDLAVVLFTSGSSGVPKAALHTQRGLAYKARAMIRAHELVPGDSILMPAPLAHVSGLLNAVLIPGV